MAGEGNGACQRGSLQGIILGSLLAALAMHAYGVVSFMFLGWHRPKPVKDAATLTSAIKSTITETGVYALPNCVNPETGAPLKMDAVMKASKEGPFMFAVIRPGENKRPFVSMILANYVYCFLASLALGMILMRVPLLRMPGEDVGHDWPLRGPSRVAAAV